MSTERSHRKLPKSYVGKEVTDQRIERYKKQKYDAQCKNSPKAKEGKDTLSIWYDTEHIEELLQEIKDAGGNGLRISFGMCEDDHPQYASQTCLLFNVTRLDEKNNTVDVTVESEPDFPERLKVTEEAKKKEDFNFGSLCPPRCNPTGIGG